MKNMAFEVRYNGTWGRNLWSQYDYTYGNINITENGFLNEFKLAQRNLQANIAAGKGNTMAYTGVAGTAPLPIMLAYFQGVPAAQSGDPSKYTSTQFANSTVLTALALYNPQPCCSTSSSTPSLAYYLFNDATRRANALTAGLPVNFFVVNPDVSNNYIYKSDGFTNYNALQLELRQRMARGTQFMINYQFATSYNSRSLGQRYALIPQMSTSVPRHALKATWDYTIPVGRGKQFGTNMRPWLDAVIGGWEFHGAGRVQNRWLDFGNVRVVGMTVDELRKAYGIRIAPDPVTGVKTVYTLPQDIIDNTIKAFSTSATSATGYGSLGAPQGRYLAPANGPDCIQTKAGDCAALNNYVMSPLFRRFDVSLAKKFRFMARLDFDIRLDVMNVFNNINFNPVAQASSSATINQVTAAYMDMSNTFDPGGRLGQLVFRFSW